MRGTSGPRAKNQHEHWRLVSARVPFDYVNGLARPAAERQSPLRNGFAFDNPRSFEPLSATETQAYNARLFARRTCQNTSLLVAKVRTADTEENWDGNQTRS